MRITEGHLRRIVRSIIREGAEVDSFFKKFEDSCNDLSDPAEVAGAYKEAMEDRKGGVNPEQTETIKKFADSLKSSLGSMCKNYAAQLKTGAPDSQKQALSDIHSKVKAYIEKCEMQLAGKREFL